MKRTLAFWAVVSLCLVGGAAGALAQDQPAPAQPPVSAADDTLTTTGEEKPAAAAPAAVPDTVSAGARARRAPAQARTIHPVISLGVGSAINHEPENFSSQYDPSFGIMLSGGARRGGLVLALTFDYNFFLANGTTPDDLSVLMLFADLKFSPMSSTARPYLLACGGMYRTWIVDDDYTETVLGYGGGAGVEVEIGPTRRLFFEGRYIQAQTRERTDQMANTEVVPFRFGMTWEIK
jgi:hypothetical protein